MMRTNKERLIRIPKDQSDSIELIMTGPFVEALCSAFEDIDRVRREGGLAKPFRPVSA